MVATGVAADGRREVLGFEVSDSEDARSGSRSCARCVPAASQAWNWSSATRRVDPVTRAVAFGGCGLLGQGSDLGGHPAEQSADFGEPVLDLVGPAGERAERPVQARDLADGGGAVAGQPAEPGVGSFDPWRPGQRGGAPRRPSRRHEGVLGAEELLDRVGPGERPLGQADQNLTHIIGGFCWVASTAKDPRRWTGL